MHTILINLWAQGSSTRNHCVHQISRYCRQCQCASANGTQCRLLFNIKMSWPLAAVCLLLLTAFERWAGSYSSEYNMKSCFAMITQTLTRRLYALVKFVRTCMAGSVLIILNNNAILNIKKCSTSLATNVEYLEITLQCNASAENNKKAWSEHYPLCAHIDRCRVVVMSRIFGVLSLLWDWDGWKWKRRDLI